MELNEFRLPNSSDDLCLFFCIYPSSMLRSVPRRTVQVTEGQFVASSPDERAILDACFNHGLVYNGELNDGRISVTVQGKLEQMDVPALRKQKLT